MEYQVKISSVIKFTENTEKVKKAIANFFPLGESVIRESSNEKMNKEISVEDDEKVLENLKEEVKEKGLEEIFEKIIDYNENTKTATFYINKQAAYLNRLNFISKDLPTDNEIEVDIYTKDFPKFMNWFLRE